MLGTFRLDHLPQVLPTSLYKQTTNTNLARMSFICHIHNYTEYNEEWNVFSAFNPSKCTHLEQWAADCAAPGEQTWTSCRSRDSNPQPWVTSGFKSNALSIRPTTAQRFDPCLPLPLPAGGGGARVVTQAFCARLWSSGQDPCFVRHDIREKNVLLPECMLQTKQSVKTKEVDDVFSRRPMYCGRAGSNVIGQQIMFLYVCFRHRSRWRRSP